MKGYTLLEVLLTVLLIGWWSLVICVVAHFVIKYW